MKAAAPALGLLLCGCITASGTVAKPTALERQLLGAYEELDKSMVHASSVRASKQTAATFEKLKAQAIEMRALQRFNEDDVLELKSAGCLAESLRAALVARPCKGAERDPVRARRLARVVREENSARGAILTWAAYALARQRGRASPSAEELEEIRSAYQRLLQEAARPGHLLEVAPGRFAPKSGEAITEATP